MTDASNVIKMGGPGLIGAAKQVTEGRAGAQQTMQRQEAELTKAYESLLAAAKMGSKYFGKAAEMYEYIKQLIASATDLAGAAQMLMEIAATGTPEQFMEAAKLVAGKALDMVRAAEAAAAMEQDPVKKQLMKDAAQELRAAAQAYIAAAKAYRENPTPENKAAMERAYERLQAAMQAVIAATKGEFGGDLSTDKGKLALSSQALEGAARQLVWDAKNSTPSEAQASAELLLGVAEAVASDLERIAASETNPRKKKKLLADAANIRKGAQVLASAAQRAAANPNDAAAAEAMDRAHAELLSIIDAARKHAGLIPGDGDDSDDEEDEEAQEEARMIQIRMQKGKEAQALAQAAQEQAATALRLADEAETLAAQISDPKKRAEIQAAIREIRSQAARVIAAAERVVANPADTNAHAELESAQRDLGQAIHKVVVLTGAHGDADVAAALQDMLNADARDGSANAIFLAAESLLGDFVASLLDTTNMDPKEVLRRAKELSAKAAELIKQLRAMAAETSDPIFKQKLLDAANLISDNSMQCKILAMVRASSQSPDKANTVGNSARLLQTNINDILREVRAEQLRTRFRDTVRQTMAINRVMKAWKGKANLA
jgi:hypothetical protein